MVGQDVLESQFLSRLTPILNQSADTLNDLIFLGSKLHPENCDSDVRIEQSMSHSLVKMPTVVYH